MSAFGKSGHWVFTHVQSSRVTVWLVTESFYTQTIAVETMLREICGIRIHAQFTQWLRQRKGPHEEDLFLLARPERFELPTARFVAEYSIQLSYGRIVSLSISLAEREGFEPSKGY